MKRLLLFFTLFFIASAASHVCESACTFERCDEYGCRLIGCGNTTYICTLDGGSGTLPTSYTKLSPCEKVSCPGVEYTCVYDPSIGTFFTTEFESYCGSCPKDMLDCDQDGTCETFAGDPQNCGECDKNCNDCYLGGECVQSGDGYQCSGEKKTVCDFCEGGVCDGRAVCVDLDNNHDFCFQCFDEYYGGTGGWSWEPGCTVSTCDQTKGWCCGDDGPDETWLVRNSGPEDCCIRGELVKDGTTTSDSSYLCVFRKPHACIDNPLGLETGSELYEINSACMLRGNHHCSPEGAWVLGEAEGQTVCDGNCVDLMTDIDHCGACNSPCSLDQYCDSGVCHSQESCGDGICGFDETCFEDGCCNGQTVDLSQNPDHCGACKNACPENAYCDNYGCYCEDGYRWENKTCALVSEAECASDQDCEDGDTCTVNRCESGSCVSEPPVCGVQDGCCSCEGDPDCIAHCETDFDCDICMKCADGVCVPESCGVYCGEGKVCHSVSGGSYCVPLPEACRTIKPDCREYFCEGEKIMCERKAECAVSSAECSDDSDCEDGNDCTYNLCDPFDPLSDALGCVEIILGCGSECEGGVCDSNGDCVQRGGEGGTCECDDMCDFGLECIDGLCTAFEGCGDGVCGEDECSRCPGDCSLEECVLNDVCDWPIGENCVNSPIACACPPGKNCDVNGEHADVRDTLFCYSSVAACGDGICTPKKCHTCALDCEGPNEICLGDGYCDSIIGENCANSPDCSCDFEVVLPEEEQSLGRGSKRTVSFKIKNTGTSKETYRIQLFGNLDLGWDDASVELGPGEESLQQVEVSSDRSGLHYLEIGVEQGGQLTRTAIPFSIAEPTIIDTVLETLDPVLSAKDILEFIAFLGAGIYGFFHLFWKKNPPKPTSYAGQPRTMYDYGDALSPSRP